MLKVTLTAEECVRSNLPPGEYCVTFHHYTNDSGRPKTRCMIHWPEARDGIGAVNGVATCHPDDKPNGAVGEWRALDNALHHMWPDAREGFKVHREFGMNADEVNPRQKATRTMFWDAYWKRFRRGKALTLRERLLRAHDRQCSCYGDGKPPCEQYEHLCLACSMVYSVLGQGVMPDHKIDCRDCGWPEGLCDKREARYAPRKKKETPNV